MKSNEKVLLVGGAGYVGTVICRALVDKGYNVRCADNLIYDQAHGIQSLLAEPRFEFRNFDIRARESMDSLMEGVSHLIILAGLVGDPITKRYEDLSLDINQRAMSSFIDQVAEYRLNKLVFISTCSNYGLIGPDELADEDFELRPLSLYAKSKVVIEQRLLSLAGSVNLCPVVLRFATAFGLSSRMRFDLTVNEFAREMTLGNPLEVYDPDTWRPYCHVKDFARLIEIVLEADTGLVRGEVFNAGGNNNNATKRMLIELIGKSLPSANVRFRGKGSDPRNYRVNFNKVRDILSFEPKYAIADGISEIIAGVLSGQFFPNFNDPNFFGNYFIAEHK